MNDQWICKIVFRPDMITNAVYLVQDHGNSRAYLQPDGIMVSYMKNSLPEKDPYFAMLDDDQLRALQSAISDHGVKPPEASYTQGKLEATEKHLEDMRSIVGHVKKIPLNKGEK